jgi:hypothetical protein
MFHGQLNMAEEKAASLRSDLEKHQERGGDTHGLREQVVILENEKEMAERVPFPSVSPAVRPHHVDPNVRT